MKLELRKDEYTWTRIYVTTMHDGPMILWILLVECNPDSNVSFDAHYAIIVNATFSKYNNDVNTLCTALKQAKSDIIRNSGTYPEKMYKQLSIKAQSLSQMPSSTNMSAKRPTPGMKLATSTSKISSKTARDST